MTHLPYVAASYVLGFGVPITLAVSAWRRLTGIRRRLAAVDPRASSRASDSRAPLPGRS